MRTPILQSISPEASPQEVAAIVGAIAELTRAQAAPAAPSTTGVDEWVHTARLGARRAGLQRGPWRLSGRIGRRTRA
jgi:hypothetical protein